MKEFAIEKSLEAIVKDTTVAEACKVTYELRMWDSATSTYKDF
jgi:hypothetical protein